MRDNPAPAPSRALRKAAMCLLGLCPAWPLLASDEPRENYALPLHLDYLPAAFYTFRPEDMWLPPTRSWWLDASDWAMDQRDVQSRHVEDFGAWLDRALSGELVRDRNNESYLRLGFSTRWEKSNMPGLKPEARFRLDLPTVEEKWRLVIESEADEFLSLAEQKTNRRLLKDERTSPVASGALRWMALAREQFALSTDIGVRDWPPDVFWRLRGRANWNLPADWSLQFDQRLYYFHQQGWGESSRVTFVRWLPGDLRFAASSELRWEHDERNFELSQIVGVGRVLSSRMTVSPRLGLLGNSRPNWQSSEYFTDITWRYRLHKDWLYAELIPALTFPREDDFKENPSITFRIEMLFFGRED